MATFPEGYDPAKDPNLGPGKFNPVTNTWEYKRRGVRRPSASQMFLAKPSLIAELVAKYGVPVPDPNMYPTNPLSHARSVGALVYWSDKGCKHHGAPALRYASMGRCVKCEEGLKRSERQQRKALKQEMRTPLDELPKTQIEAVVLGSVTFFTGRPCSKNGHIAERYTSSNHCLQCKDPGYVLPPATRSGKV